MKKYDDFDLNSIYSIKDIHIECSKQFKQNLYFDVSGQSGPIWAVLKHKYNSMYMAR